MQIIKVGQLDHYGVFTTLVKQFLLHCAMTYKVNVKTCDTNDANLHIHAS